MKAGEGRIRAFRFASPLILLAVTLLVFAEVQARPQGPQPGREQAKEGMQHGQGQADAGKSAEVGKATEGGTSADAEKSFDLLKGLAGTWRGPVTTVPMDKDMENTPTLVTLRVTSRGNALVHEMKADGTADDPAKYDHPLTMLYVDSGRLFLVHYCDAGNRPRMEARATQDAKKVEFDFVDLSGGNQYGHMDHAIFTIIDANHHVEDWTYIMPGDKPVHAHLDLQRAG